MIRNTIRRSAPAQLVNERGTRSRAQSAWHADCSVFTALVLVESQIGTRRWMFNHLIGCAGIQRRSNASSTFYRRILTGKTFSPERLARGPFFSRNNLQHISISPHCVKSSRQIDC